VSRPRVARLANKIALITGAGSGFGEGIARTFAREGAKIAAVDINHEAAQTVAAAIGAGAIAVRADVSKAPDVEAAVQATTQAFGGLDILVNNAGVAHKRGPLAEVSEEEFDRVMAVNLKSIFLFARAVVPLLRARGGGVIINIGSTAGIRPRPGLTWYNASKGAVNLMSKSMALELAPDRIRVCALAPTIGETALLPTFMGGDSEELREKFRASVPLGRLSTPQDVANAALFFASAEAEFLTGTVLEIDGGRTI
jgi:3-oxoacyl-[acyl-carrier protein] reductase